ncbi:MAG: M18 family aminopeptidase [Clostridiales bacterium]|nr:M18 family aminopeptidase [Clostridiales bacterium]
MTKQIENVSAFLESSLTAFHARDNVKKILEENGFVPLKETQDWEINEGGKYFVERATSLIAFSVGKLERYAFKIVASHLDSPAFKIKENPEINTEGLITLNVEKYGGGLWYTFFDRPLKIAGQLVLQNEGRLETKTVEASFPVTIPSQALHINREANDHFAVNLQTDVLPLFGLNNGESFLQSAFPNEENILDYDLFLVSAEKPYLFGKDEAFLASPRVDNLTSVFATLNALLSCAESNGICVATFLNHEEIGSVTREGAGGDFLDKTLRKMNFALRFDDNEYDKALATSFCLSVDNAHALHPNHPEKSDPTNHTKLGDGIVVKKHADGAYVTNALSLAVVKTVLNKAGVPYQNFFNRSDAKSGSTLGVALLSKVSVLGADIGMAQLAMHSACETFAVKDYHYLLDGLTAFYSSEIEIDNETVVIE